MGESRKSQALLIGSRMVLDDELSSLLNGYGYSVEQSRTRLEGVRKFRAQRQALVIVDARAVGRFPERFFRYFRMVRESAIVLVATEIGQRADSSRYLLLGAHDVLQLPLHREALGFTLSRASAYHRYMVRTTFYRNAVYFAGAILPLWALLAYLALR